MNKIIEVSGLTKKYGDYIAVNNLNISISPIGLNSQMKWIKQFHKLDQNNHFDEMSGVSFLPYSDHVYKQAPYQDIEKEEYEEMMKKMPHQNEVDWSLLQHYEKADTTVGTQELACSAAGGCELV